jgi:16S rRNA (uracil1498-N3)-methyltransferase
VSPDPVGRAAQPARTRGPHFFVDAVAGDRVALEGDDARHLAVVLRAGPGDPVSLADGTGVVHQAEVVAAAPSRVDLSVTASHRVDDPSPRLTVVQALPKGRKLDEVVQRLTEVGVDRLVPVRSARSEVRLDDAKAAKQVARWRAVALAASKQSRRTRPLEVADVGRWATAFPAGADGVVLWEESDVPLRRVLDVTAPRLVLGIGPEGGLTAEEVRRTGLPDASLGPTVLRTETAAIVAASVTFALAGRLG